VSAAPKNQGIILWSVLCHGVIDINMLNFGSYDD